VRERAREGLKGRGGGGGWRRRVREEGGIEEGDGEHGEEEKWVVIYQSC